MGTSVSAAAAGWHRRQRDLVAASLIAVPGVKRRRTVAGPEPRRYVAADAAPNTDTTPGLDPAPRAPGSLLEPHMSLGAGVRASPVTLDRRRLRAAPHHDPTASAAPRRILGLGFEVPAPLESAKRPNSMS